MSHKLPKIEASLINNTPHLISTESLENILSIIDTRDSVVMSKEEFAIAQDIRSRNKLEKNLGENDVALLRVQGTLTYEQTMWTALCGDTSYQGLLDEMRTAVKEGYSTVVLDVNSGGGQAYQTFSTARQLRKLADDHGIKLIAYVDGISASAAYALSAIADEVIMHPQAEVGSIGVVTRLVNNNEKLKKDGYKTVYVTAGDSKIPFTEDGEFRKEFLEDIQSKVDSLYSEFVSHVANFRNISEEVVRETEAKMFMSNDALELGLVDKVMELEDFYNYLADLVEEGDMPLKFMKKEKEEEQMATEDNAQPQASAEKVELSTEQQAQLAEMQKQLAELTAEREQLIKEKEEAALAELAGSLSEMSFVQDKEQMAEVLFGLNDAGRDVVLGALQQADKQLEAAVSETLVVEEEAEEKLDSDPKSSMREKIQAKYAAKAK